MNEKEYESYDRLKVMGDGVLDVNQRNIVSPNMRTLLQNKIPF